MRNCKIKNNDKIKKNNTQLSTGRKVVTSSDTVRNN